jgi:hypothetical protein
MVLGVICNGEKDGFREGCRKLGLGDFKNLIVYLCRVQFFLTMFLTMPKPFVKLI